MNRIKYFHLTLVRHGETNENRNGIVQGHLDTDLCANGLLQAIQTGLRLRHTVLDLIYCSDLKRTVQTAHQIVSRNDYIKRYSASPLQSIIQSTLFRERNFGMFNGANSIEWRQAQSEASKRGETDGWRPSGDAETDLEVKERAANSFSLLCKAMMDRESKTCCYPCPLSMKDQSNDCQLVVNLKKLNPDRVDSYEIEYLGHLLLITHGGIIKRLLKYFSTISVVPLSVDGQHIGNCSITQLSVMISDKKDVQVDVHSIGSTEHLSNNWFKKYLDWIRSFLYQI